MSPTIFREKGYRFFFFSREESRMHVHVISGDGDAKFWLEPEIQARQELPVQSRTTERDRNLN